MTIDEFVTSLSEYLGEPLMWENDAVRLVFDDDLAVTIEYEDGDDAIFLYADVADIPESRCGEHAVAMLKANLFGSGTGGSAVLSYDDEIEKIVLWDRIELEGGGFPIFTERLAALRRAAGHWRREIRDGGGPGGGTGLDRGILGFQA